MASDFSSALTIWRELRLPKVQAELHAHVEPIVEAQRNALLARKSLAERTREFRALPEDEADDAKAKLTALKPLLKAYQAEIDALSKRAKNAENALLSLHSSIEPAPDPYPLLEVILDQTAALTELDSLKASNARLHRDLQTIHLASEKTQNALTDRIRNLENQLETKVADAIQSTRSELTASYDEKLRNASEREAELQQSLTTAQDQVTELRTQLAASAANEEDAASAAQANSETLKAHATKLAQLDMITADLTRAQARSTTLERRNEELRAELEALRSGREAEDRLAELSASLNDARTQAESLREALSLERARAAETADASTRRTDELQRKVEKAERERASLAAKLDKWADYDELKRELDIFRSVEFAQYEEDNGGGAEDDAGQGDGSHTASSGAGAGGGATKTLESMLVQKNKRLQDDLTSERVSHNELKAEHARVNADLGTARAEVDRLRALTERLENDLLQLNVPALTGTSRGKDAASGSDKMNGKAANGVAGALDGKGTTDGSREAGADSSSSADPFDLASLTNASSSNPAVPRLPTSSATQPAASNTSSTTTTATTTTTAESSLLPIITSQRDRFRARNAELEEELRTQFATISELRAEVKHLQADNLGLYEKVRYLQSYASACSASGAGAGGSGVGGLNAGSKGGEGGYPPALVSAAAQSQPPRIVVDRNVGRGGGGGEDRYRDRYEEHMDPFASFRGREQSRAYAALNPLERLLHMVTRTVLGHRRMRIAFTAYALGLHVLVLLILFEYEFGGRRWTRSESSIGVSPANNPGIPPG